MSLVLGSPALDTALQMGLPQCSLEGKDHLSRPAGEPLLNGAQGAVGLLCHTATLLAHGQLVALQGPLVLLSKPAFQPVSCQPVLVRGVIPAQGQDFVFPLVELHEVPLCPVLQPAQVLQSSSATSRCISHSSCCGLTPASN